MTENTGLSAESCEVLYELAELLVEIIEDDARRIEQAEEGN